MNNITISQQTFVACFPYGCTSEVSTAYTEFMPLVSSFGLNTKNRIAMFLAQVGHESGSFRYAEECGSGVIYNKREDLGNTMPEAREAAKKHNMEVGSFYKGRGYIQITGYTNYKRFGALMGLDLVNKPTLLKEPKYAMRSAMEFWKSNNLNALADINDFEKITRRINGGLNGYADRQAVLAHILKVW
jgi:putative chitinase